MKSSILTWLLERRPNFHVPWNRAVRQIQFRY